MTSNMLNAISRKNYNNLIYLYMYLVAQDNNKNKVADMHI